MSDKRLQEIEERMGRLQADIDHVESRVRGLETEVGLVKCGDTGDVDQRWSRELNLVYLNVRLQDVEKQIKALTR